MESDLRIFWWLVKIERVFGFLGRGGEITIERTTVQRKRTSPIINRIMILKGRVTG